MNRIFKFTLIISSVVFISQARILSGRCQDSQHVRVNILQDETYLNIKVPGYYEIVDALKNKVLFKGRDIKSTVSAYRNGISIGNFACSTRKVMMKTNGGAIQINGRRFKGDILFIKKDNLHMSVVNYIELEDYIKGILYHEASHYWPLEALKVQAIISRTFALYEMQENVSRDYDLTSDVYSQVYGGRTSERYRTNIAVEDTRNEVLTYQGRVFPTYYHATCAGHTEDASLLWGIAIVPLRGVTCGYCKESPHFNWHYSLTKDEIKKALLKAGYKINNLQDIVILGRDVSGRITKLRMKDKQKELDLSAKDFRSIIGPDIIRSTNFNLTIAGNDLAFEGLGWGHGVGLCQWGAYFMAKQGYDYEKILKYYYPGSEISRKWP